MPLDLDAYFTRIGYTGPRSPDLETLNGIAAAHAQAIPFENLNILLGQPISLDPGAVFEKLVLQRRGGYCFEQNGLLLQVLTALGFKVRPISARVRWQQARDFTPPRTHLFLRVELERESWLADVGVGGLSLTSAIRLIEDVVQETPHETRRLVHEEGRWFHQVRLGQAWADVCEFTLEEMPPIDSELANWYTSAHPQSHFRNRLVVARAAPSGIRLTLLNHEFTIRGSDGQANTRKLVSPDELLTVLDEHFGLHFHPDTRFDRGTVVWPW